MLLVGGIFSTGAYAQHVKSFEIKDGHFYLNGEITPILSGEMHYARIPHEYWRHRLQMMKGMGLNTVATYVFWNLHEPEPGKWDFSGDKDLAEYIRIAGEEGMMVILRPGPYVCAEWEFGGYPWWLQNVPGMEVRRDNEAFLAHTKAYIERLYQEVGDLQFTKGGPIIMVQCENEFGSYVSQRQDIPLEEHKAYNARIKQQLADACGDEGISRNYIQRIETAASSCSLDTLIEIAKVFACFDVTDTSRFKKLPVVEDQGT